MSDPTDPGGVTGSHERGPRNTTRVGDSGSPVGSPLTILLAVIAVAAGFLIFRSISDDGNAGGSGLGGETTLTPVTDPSGATIAATAPVGATTPEPAGATPRTGASVIVINASEVPESAAAMTTELTDLGYTMEPGVSDNDSEALAATVVYFAGPGGPEAVARTLAADLGNVTVEAAPAEIPISPDDSQGAATVYVILGTDLAGKSLPLPVAPSLPPVPSTPTTA